MVRSAPLGAALGIMTVAGAWWGTAAGREREASCAGTWEKEKGETSRAATVRLADRAPASGGVLDADVLPGSCGGPLRLRWPEQHVARGGTEWVVAGPRGGGARPGGVVGGRRGLLVAPPPGPRARAGALSPPGAG